MPQAVPDVSRTGWAAEVIVAALRLAAEAAQVVGKRILDAKAPGSNPAGN